MKRYFCIILPLLLSVTAKSDIQLDAEKMIGDSVTSILSVLSNKSLDSEAKKRVIIETINPIFDFALMAKLTLGKRQWMSSNPDQQVRFVTLFTKRMHTSVLEKFLLFEDETVELGKSELVKNKIHIPMTMESKGERYSILYKIYTTGEQLKVYDIEIQGISLISTYRSQYSQVLSKGPMEDLFKIMKEKIQLNAQQSVIASEKDNIKRQ